MGNWDVILQKNRKKSYSVSVQFRFHGDRYAILRIDAVVEPGTKRNLWTKIKAQQKNWIETSLDKI